MHSKLEGLGRLDHWLLSRTRWELRQIALLIALVINVPQAWMFFRTPLDIDAGTTVSGFKAQPPRFSD